MFKLPRVSPGSRSVELRASELAMILDGIDMTKLNRGFRVMNAEREPFQITKRHLRVVSAPEMVHI